MSRLITMLSLLLLVAGLVHAQTPPKAKKDEGSGASPAREPLLLEGHSDMVSAVAFRPDGRQIATGSSDRTVRIWDPANGKLLRRIDHFPGSVTDLTFTVDGSQLVTVAYDTRERKLGQSAGLVQVWDAATGKEILAIPLKASQEAVCVTPDGKRVLAGGSDRMLRVWDLKSGKETFALAGHTGTIRSLAVSSDGALIASAANDGSVRLWDSATGKEKATLRHSATPALAVAFTPDGKFLVSAGVDKTARLWDVAEGKVVLKAEGHTAPILGVAMKPDGAAFATLSGPDGMRLWDRKSGMEVRRLALTDRPYRTTFSPDGKRLALACFDGATRLYDLTAESK
ncbi:WD40 repeat domain-containing protein [Zavarzinella formosa]|uniref:WD40 repeat domain-containing protein n=1 Tax=Zavarzinella formosa TaxID=360055 RepID=UPI000300874B|nr:WD40 repeat domain-containing protein [Zavarzinella formosa]